MKAGFRGWLYRWISAGFGLVGIVVCLSLVELSRLYGIPGLNPGAGVGLGLSFLLLIGAFIGTWSWKRYGVLCLVMGAILGLPYLALRPEMLRDDVLKQLVNPPLSVDLVFYRTLALRNDAERDEKIQRLQFLYGFVGTYRENLRAAIPEAK